MRRLIPALLSVLVDEGVDAGISSPGDVENRAAFVRVMRAGGGDDYEQLRDEPIIDFEVYANSYGDADKTVWQVHDLIRQLRGRQINGLTFRRCFRVSGPVPIPDNNPKIIRLLLTFELSVKRAS